MSGIEFEDDVIGNPVKEVNPTEPTYKPNVGNHTPSVASGSSMTSRFDAEITPVAGKVIDHVNEMIKSYGLTGKAVPVSIANSKSFRGVGIVLQIGNTTYLQPVVFDERRTKNIEELIEEGKATRSILFAPAILNKANAKYLEDFDNIVKDNVKRLQAIVVSSEQYSTDALIDAFSKDMLKRIEATPFTAVAESIAKDKSKVVTGLATFRGQNVKLQLTHKDSNATIEDMIIGAAGSILDVEARVETIVGGKTVTDYNTQMQKNVYAPRPVVFIKQYNKQGTFAKFNLEYALLSIVASSVLTKPDKVISALLPNKETGSNIGALNDIFKIHPEKDGSAKPINFLKAGVDLPTMIAYINKAITPATIGIDLEYRSNTTSFSVFAALTDKDTDATEMEKIKKSINDAYINVTGKAYSGELIEKFYQYPTGDIVFRDGTIKPISDVDGIWLASLGKTELATRWLMSDGDQTMVTKINILSELAATDMDIEIKIRSIGYKIILASAFINALVDNSGFNVESAPILDLGLEQTGFSGIKLEVNTGISSAAISPIGNTGRSFTIIG